jgi:hypothetical protein
MNMTHCAPNIQFSNRSYILSFALLCLVFIGCDPTGEYDARRKISLQKAGQLAQVSKHLGAEVSVPDHTRKGSSGVSFSVPKIFGTQALAAGVAGTPLKAAVLYEMAETFGDGPLLYITVMGTDEAPDEEALKTFLETAIKTVSPQATVTAEEVQLEPLGSKAVPKMLRVNITGPQAFFRAGAGAPVATEQPGLTDIYIVRGNADVVAFIFRATTAGATANSFEEVIQASMRTISVK